MAFDLLFFRKYKGWLNGRTIGKTVDNAEFTWSYRSCCRKCFSLSLWWGESFTLNHAQQLPLSCSWLRNITPKGLYLYTYEIWATQKLKVLDFSKASSMVSRKSDKAQLNLSGFFNKQRENHHTLKEWFLRQFMYLWHYRALFYPK